MTAREIILEELEEPIDAKKFVRDIDEAEILASQFTEDWFDAQIDFPPDDPDDDEETDGSRFRESHIGGTEAYGYADAVRRALGDDRVQIFGYYCEDNPSAMLGYSDGGHDFAIVDGKFIVDGWGVCIDGNGPKIVYDIEQERELVINMFGPRSAWVLL